jgi:hypothetical protein
MDDQELLNFVEQAMFHAMLEGCFVMSNIGYTDFEAGSWSVRLSADEVARLLDMAKEKNT